GLSVPFAEAALSIRPPEELGDVHFLRIPEPPAEVAGDLFVVLVRRRGVGEWLRGLLGSRRLDGREGDGEGERGAGGAREPRGPPFRSAHPRSWATSTSCGSPSRPRRWPATCSWSWSAGAAWGSGCAGCSAAAGSTCARATPRSRTGEAGRAICGGAGQRPAPARADPALLTLNDEPDPNRMPENESPPTPAEAERHPRLTPYELVFTSGDFEARVFPRIREEAVEQGLEKLSRERFDFLST